MGSITHSRVGSYKVKVSVGCFTVVFLLFYVSSLSVFVILCAWSVSLASHCDISICLATAIANCPYSAYKRQSHYTTVLSNSELVMSKLLPFHW